VVFIIVLAWVVAWKVALLLGSLGNLCGVLPRHPLYLPTLVACHHLHEPIILLVIQLNDLLSQVYKLYAMFVPIFHDSGEEFLELFKKIL
jgi:hypothetical protein